MKKTILAAGFIAAGGLLYGQTKDSIRNQDIETVVIYGRKTFAPNTISRQNLEVLQAPSIGETLSRVPGIQNTSYGPVAGAPMIRSLSGNRVKVLKNGMGVNDLSGISPDFAIEFNPDLINDIKIYKGASTVLFGGKAIGGAIDMGNSVIPKDEKKSISGSISMEGSYNGGYKQALNASGKMGKSFLWQLGATNAQRDVVYIPGEAKSSLCKDPYWVGFDPVMQSLCQVNVKSEHELNISIFPYLDQFVLDHINVPNYELSENDKYTFRPKYYDSATRTYKDNPKNPAFVAGQDPVKDRYKPVVKSINDYVATEKGKMPNSHSEQRGAYLGIGFVSNRFSTGVRYEGNYSYYGIPAFALYETPVHSHTAPAKTVVLEYLPINIDSRSHRIQNESVLNVDSKWLKDVKLKYSGQFSENYELLKDYHANGFHIAQHTGRLELSQKPYDFWEGVTGADYDYRDITGKGKRRYMPNALSREAGFFTLQKLKFNYIEGNVGYRYDLINRVARPDATYTKGRGLAGGKLSERNFCLHQASVGVTLKPTNTVAVGMRFSHSERAPEVNELYTGNRHFAILTEENGDDTLNKEQANAFELTAKYASDRLHISATGYQSAYKNYIYLAHTGISRDGFAVKEWRSGDTEIRGVEAEAAYIFNHHYGNLELGGFFDLVQNRNTDSNEIRKHSDGDYMPNMPVSRYGFNLTGNINGFSANIMAERYLKQKYLGKNINPEPAMPGYTMLSARLAYKASLVGHPGEIYLFGTNLLNVEARPQNSVLKYIAPLPGINIGLGMKASL